jgi:hypothetical protein
VPPKKTVPVRSDLRAKAVLTIETPPAVALDQRSIGDGRKPFASRRTDIAAIRAKAVELYGIPAAGLAPAQTIDAAFKFAPLESDAEFNSLHVEPLLEQSEALLDRCAAAKSRYDELQMEKWKLQVELDRFLRLDQVAEQEFAAGVATLPYERATLESAAESRLESNHKSADAELSGLAEELLASGLNKRMAARELAAWITAFPQKDNDLRGDDATYVFDGVSKTKADHLFDAARLEADEAAWEEIAELMARRFAAIAASEAGRLRKESLELETKWSLANVAFRRERAQADRDAFWEKVYQTQQPGTLSNYGERLPAIEMHFSATFREALARIAAARQGLKEIYNYAPAFPAEGSPRYFDEVAIWLKNAQDRIAHFSQLDQTYVLALSVKDLAKAGWESGRAASQWSFDIPDTLFNGQAHVRLRGLGLAVAGEPEDAAAAQKKAAKADTMLAKPQGFWSASLALPATATIRNMAGASSDLDQKALPPCYFGQVANRDSGPAEVAGVNALHNASPIGKQWKVTLSAKSTDGFPTANLNDVILYLHVAVRGQREA